jgi:hypothetical protein
MPSDAPDSRPGLFNVLRFIAVLAVLALALLAVLVVFDIVPRSALADLSTKIALLAFDRFPHAQRQAMTH